MAYYCQCGQKLKSTKIDSGRHTTGTTKRLSYKVLIVKTLRAYKCPNGCILETIKQT